MRESVLAASRGTGTADEAVILGILSLIIWALILIVTVKYVLILLRADNNGEGGTLALMALAHRALGGKGFAIILLGIISAALFYGDAMITPALSVLSAVEGLEVATPGLEILCRAARRRDPVRPVRGPVEGHGQGRRLVRADHACLVRGHRARRPVAHRAEFQRAPRFQPCSMA